jgi:hypothetical protein
VHHLLPLPPTGPVELHNLLRRGFWNKNFLWRPYASVLRFFKTSWIFRSLFKCVCNWTFAGLRILRTLLKIVFLFL